MKWGETPRGFVSAMIRPRIHLRTFLVLIALVALGLGIWDAFLSPYRRWQRAIRDDDDRGRRWEAALRFTSGPVDGLDVDTAVAELIEALDDPSFRVRETTVSALGHYGSKAKVVVPALIRRVETDELSIVRVRAVQSLGEILSAGGGEKRVIVNALIRALENRSRDVRIDAAVVLASHGGEMAMPASIELLKSDRLDVQQAALLFLGRSSLRAKAAVPALIELVKDTAPGDDHYLKRCVRTEAADLLIGLGEPEIARRALDDLSKDENEFVRQAVETALKHHAPLVVAPSFRSQESIPPAP
jgi:HEAT repeat protein